MMKQQILVDREYTQRSMKVWLECEFPSITTEEDRERLSLNFTNHYHGNREMIAEGEHNRILRNLCQCGRGDPH